jgi:hypothetical protein
MILTSLAMALAVPQEPPAVEGEEIVVTARRKKCTPAIAEDVIRDPLFVRRSADWRRGVAVRVKVPLGSPYMCLARIAFRLNEYGVKLVYFDDGQPKPPATNMP